VSIIKNLFAKGFKASTFFFIAGVFVSMLVTSIGISSSIAKQQLLNTRYELGDVEQYELMIQTNGKIDDSFWDKLYDILYDGSGLYVANMNMPASFAKDVVPRVYPEIYKGDKGLFPILKGKYFSYENIKNKDRVALVGKNRELNLIEENEKKYVEISGTRYEVIGIIGYKNKQSVWDSSAYFPITSVPDKEKSNVFSGYMQLVLYIRSGSIEKQLESLKNLFFEVGIELMGAAKIVENKQTFLDAISPKYPGNYIIYIFFIVSLINSINIAMNWVSQRNFEIGVRKAFGHSEGNILSMIFKEMLLLFSIAAVFAVLIHFLSFKVLGSFVSLPEVFLLEAFLVSLASAFILTVTTVIFVSFKTLAVQPIEALRS